MVGAIWLFAIPTGKVVFAPLVTDVETATSEGQDSSGFLESDPEVEAVAIALVTSRYVSEGWHVRSVEADRIGYDLHCTRELDEHHVEVKGLSSEKVCFILTRNEYSRLKDDALFRLFVVVRALASPTVLEIDKTQFYSDFAVAPYSYMVTKNVGVKNG